MKLKLLLAFPLLLPLVSPQTLSAQTVSSVNNTVQPFFLEKPVTSFPNMKGNYIKTVVEPAQAAQAALKAEQDKAAAEALEQATATVTVQIQITYSGLTGSYGYAIAGGNCVNQIPVGLRGAGNPINWSVTTSTPYIGGAALWAGINHVARITGLWSNGDIEVAQENWSGVPITRFPRSTFRGFR